MTPLPEEISPPCDNKESRRRELLKRYAEEFNATTRIEAQNIGINLKAEFAMVPAIFGTQAVCRLIRDNSHSVEITTKDNCFKKPTPFRNECVSRDYVAKVVADLLLDHS